ncbi:MAG: VWA domain-containing protein [Pyrinomonadaceae bacterium]
MNMRRTQIFLFTLLAVFSTALLSRAQTTEPTPPPINEESGVEKVVTEEVKLNIAAFDYNGQFAGDVKKEDLVILENDRIHQANSLRRIPANVLIVLDTGGEMRRAKNIDLTRETAKTLVRSLRPEDSVAVIQYNDKVEVIAEWTEDKAEILNILDKRMNFGRRSLFYSAMQTATEFLGKTPLENRHLVLITDGTDSFDQKDQRDAMIRGLLSTDISVHVISYTQMEQKELDPNSSALRKGEPKPNRAPEEVINTMPNGVKDILKAPRIASVSTDREFLRNLKARRNALAEGEKYLSDLARDTNGQFILPENKDEMKAKPNLIAKLIDSSYVVTYTPKDPLNESPEGEIREVVVTSKREGLDVQARRKIVVGATDTNK